MNEAELKNLWLATSQKMEAQFVINIKNTEDFARMKTYHLLGSMKPIKIFTILAGLLWVGGGIGILTPVYLFAFEKANKYFLFSVTIQIVLSAIALFVYVYQLVLIYQTEITEPILKTQGATGQIKDIHVMGDPDFVFTTSRMDNLLVVWESLHRLDFVAIAGVVFGYYALRRSCGMAVFQYQI